MQIVLFLGLFISYVALCLYTQTYSRSWSPAAPLLMAGLLGAATLAGWIRSRRDQRTERTPRVLVSSGAFLVAFHAYVALSLYRLWDMALLTQPPEVGAYGISAALSDLAAWLVLYVAWFITARRSAAVDYERHVRSGRALTAQVAVVASLAVPAGASLLLTIAQSAETQDLATLDLDAGAWLALALGWLSPIGQGLIRALPRLAMPTAALLGLSGLLAWAAGLNSVNGFARTRRCLVDALTILLPLALVIAAFLRAISMTRAISEPLELLVAGCAEATGLALIGLICALAGLGLKPSTVFAAEPRPVPAAPNLSWDGLIRILGLALLLTTVTAALLRAEYLDLFYDGPALWIVCGVMVSGTLFCCGGAPLWQALALSLARADRETTAQAAASSLETLGVAARLALAGGLLGLFVGLVQALSTLDRLDRIGPALATAVLAPFYGVLLSELVLRLMKIRLRRKFAARLAPATPARND